MSENTEAAIYKIGGVTVDLTYYDGKDTYDEGAAEEFILDVFKNDRDIFEVMRERGDITTLFYLTPQRGTIVTPMDIKKTDTVLEVGAGLGAITGALAEKAKQVHCVELSKRRLTASAYRNKKYDNITIFGGNFNSVEFKQKYDAVVLVGVLEYAQMYMNCDNPFETFLRKLRDLLKPGGRIYIAIENRLGLKYFAGSNEDHFGQPFVGIEGYCAENAHNRMKTFSKSELEKLLTRSGFGGLYFWYPCPDYKMPAVIYSDDHLPVNDDNIPAGYDYNGVRHSAFSETKALESLVGLEEFKMLANSFLVEAVKV